MRWRWQGCSTASTHVLKPMRWHAAPSVIIYSPGLLRIVPLQQETGRSATLLTCIQPSRSAAGRVGMRAGSMARYHTHLGRSTRRSVLLPDEPEHCAVYSLHVGSPVCTTVTTSCAVHSFPTGNESTAVQVVAPGPGT